MYIEEKFHYTCFVEAVLRILLLERRTGLGTMSRSILEDILLETVFRSILSLILRLPLKRLYSEGGLLSISVERPTNVQVYETGIER